MPFHSLDARSQPSRTSPPADAPSPLQSPRDETPPLQQGGIVTDRMVASTLTWTILELEEHQIPSQGAGDLLYVYAGDIVLTHDIRRTLKVFDGDVDEAVSSICRFVVDGIMGQPPARSS